MKRLPAILLLLLWLPWLTAQAADSGRVTLNLRDVDIAEAMAMLAKQQRLNILLSQDVEGTLSLNLYDVPIANAVHAIANAAGYAVERRDGAYFIIEHEKVGMYNNGNVTRVQGFNVHYADPQSLEEMLQPYLSRYGKIKSIPERKLILVSDKPEFLSRIALLVGHADVKPKQVIIEAKILEISLNEEDAYGIDWQKLFDSQGGSGTFGSRGLSGAGGSASSGFLFDFVNPNVDMILTALRQDGRVRTLSTPKLVALDNQEAEVIIGDRRGYQVTTTINQVTSESIEFLESGVILRVTPHIDSFGRVLMDIHPEVSTGTVDAAGIPSQTTTEVTTSLLVPSGETVFIGGLMKHSSIQSYKRVPILGRVPGLKVLFSSREETQLNTETIVLITPRVVENLSESWNTQPVKKVEAVSRAFEVHAEDLTDAMNAEEETGFGLGGRPEASAEGRVTISAGSDDSPESPGDATGEPGVGLIQPALPSLPLEELPGSLYTVQIMTMSSQEGLEAYAAEHGMAGLPTARIEHDGELYHALLLGVYDSVAKAQAAIRDLPPALRSKQPWVRPLRSLQAAMRRADDRPSTTVAKAA